MASNNLAAYLAIACCAASVVRTAMAVGDCRCRDGAALAIDVLFVLSPVISIGSDGAVLEDVAAVAIFLSLSTGMIFEGLILKGMSGFSGFRRGRGTGGFAAFGETVVASVGFRAMGLIVSFTIGSIGAGRQ